MRAQLQVIVAAFFLSACAGRSSVGSPAGTPNAGNARVITESEIAEAGVATAYDAIERLRPTMLRSRGRLEHENGVNPADTTTAPLAGRTIKVYLDGEWLGDPARLQGIPAAIVNQIQYLTSTEATTRFGAGHGSGAILVTSKYKARSPSGSAKGVKG